MINDKNTGIGQHASMNISFLIPLYIFVMKVSVEKIKQLVLIYR